MRPLTVDDLRVGLRVLFAGEEDSGDVLDHSRRAAGHILMNHHPGVIHAVTDPHHVQVDFVGLEDEPVSFGVGFGYDQETGAYPGLLVPDDLEWDRALTAGWLAE